MAYAPRSTYYDQDATIIGSFRESDHGHLFEFSVNDEPDPTYFVSAIQFPHKVWVGDGWRYGRVLNTVAYIVTDENADGTPHVDKWAINNHNTYKAA